jgi:uncharacterized membrane protein
MGAKRAERQILIEAPPQDCFDALTDYDTFPEWQSAVKSCEVISRDERGRGKNVAFEIDARVKTVSYTLVYSYEEPHLITWDYVDGDLKDVDGDYEFEDRGGAGTLATYTLLIDPGIWLPGKLATTLSEQVMKGHMEDVKRRVEAA